MTTQETIKSLVITENSIVEPRHSGNIASSTYCGSVDQEEGRNYKTLNTIEEENPEMRTHSYK